MDRRHFISGAAAAAALARPAAAIEYTPDSLTHLLGTVARLEGYETILEAARLTGLTDELAGPGPITFFAPSDRAFLRLPPGYVPGLFAPENRAGLAAFVARHIAPGYLNHDAVRGKHLDVPTLAGEMVVLDASVGIMVNTARAYVLDIHASNGVAHLLNYVIPPFPEPLPEVVVTG